MWNYILKRTLLLFFTLFLACCFGFFITRLAPGDPSRRGLEGAFQGEGQGDQGISEEIIEQNRKLYGFDKAWFFALEIDDRDTFAQYQIDRLAKPTEYIFKRAKIELNLVNTIALPHLIAYWDDKDYDFLETSPETVNSRVLEILSSVTFNYQDQQDYPKDKKNPDEWKKWWDTNSDFFSEESVEAAVKKYINQSSEENRRDVVLKGSLAVSYLMPYLKNPEKQIKISSLLGEMQKKLWVIKSDTTKEDEEYYLWRWKNWYRHNKDQFVKFSGFERFHRHFTDTQFGIWFGRILRWDFGISYEHKQPVIKLIKERLPISIQLSLISIFLSYLIAIPIGIYSSTHQYTKSDMVITVFLFILYSLPSFWVADMCLMFFTGKPFWELFPSRHLSSPEAENLTSIPWLKDRIWHLVLPIFCLTYASFAFLSRQMRVGMLETIRQDFIRTARAKGLAERVVIFKHSLRNSMIPILTLMAGVLPELLGGSIIVESIFTIEGMGKLSFDAILTRDYPVINAIIFFSSFLTLLGILISDLSYVLVDPRIRFD